MALWAFLDNVAYYAKVANLMSNLILPSQARAMQRCANAQSGSCVPNHRGFPTTYLPLTLLEDICGLKQNRHSRMSGFCARMRS